MLTFHTLVAQAVKVALFSGRTSVNVTPLLHKYIPVHIYFSMSLCSVHLKPTDKNVSTFCTVFIYGEGKVLFKED
jgi:hypothetical protein